MSRPYELGTAPPARRALADRLPPDVATAAADFLTCHLVTDPRRVGKPLAAELAGIYSARLGRSWRVMYEIDEGASAVIVLDIRPLRRLPPQVRAGSAPPRLDAAG